MNNLASHHPKNRKGGKIFSLSLIWAGAAFVVILVIIQLVTMFTTDAPDRHERDPTAATSMTERLQPMSTKIVASDSETVVSINKQDEVEDYANAWKMLYRLAPDNATPEARNLIIMTFLAGLDYTTDVIGGVIVSKSTGDIVRPSTVECYLNGYIPDKPYIKTNCPAY